MTGVSASVFPVPTSAIELWVFAAMALGSLVAAIVAITRPTALGAALAMLVSVICSAGLFVAVSASFVAVAYVLVLCAALLGFFVFGVIMLNRDDTEPVALRSGVMRGAGLLAASLSLLYVVRCFRGHAGLQRTAGTAALEFGSAASLGKALFADLGFPTQLLAMLLLVALVCALALSRAIAVSPRKE